MKLWEYIENKNNNCFFIITFGSDLLSLEQLQCQQVCNTLEDLSGTPDGDSGLWDATVLTEE